MSSSPSLDLTPYLAVLKRARVFTAPPWPPDARNHIEQHPRLRLVAWFDGVGQMYGGQPGIYVAFADGVHRLSVKELVGTITEEMVHVVDTGLNETAVTLRVRLMVSLPEWRDAVMARLIRHLLGQGGRWHERRRTVKGPSP